MANPNRGRMKRKNPGTARNPESKRRIPTSKERFELIQLFHTSRIAGKESRFDRLRWAANEFVKVHPEWSSTNAFIAVDNATRFGE